MSEGDELYTLVNEGLALYHADKFFEAHEIWEYAWGAEVGRTKLALQALILIAAGLYKHQCGNPRGTCKLLAKAKDKMEEVRSGASAWLGIDLVALAAGVDRALADADAIATGARTEAPSVPKLPRAVGSDGIVYLHGFASGPSSAKANMMVPPLRAGGWHVEVPDLNEDDFEHLTVSRAIARVKRCLRDRTVIIGSSLGGYIASLVAAKDDRVKGLILMAPAFDFAPRMRARYGDAAIADWKARGKIEIEHYAYKTMRPIGYGLLEDAEKHPPRPPIVTPTYILHGQLDDTVPAATSRELAAKYPKLIELDVTDDDHALTKTAPRALEAVKKMLEKLALEKQPAESSIDEAMKRIAELDAAAGR